MSFDGLLNRRCNIEVATRVQDADSGQMIDSWGVLLPGVACRLDVKSGGKVVGPEAIYEKVSHILFMRRPLGIDLDTKTHRIDIDGDKYSILLVSDVYGQKNISHLELYLVKVN